MCDLGSLVRWRPLPGRAIVTHLVTRRPWLACDPLLANSTGGVRYRPWPGKTSHSGPARFAGIRARWCQTWASLAWPSGMIAIADNQEHHFQYDSGIISSMVPVPESPGPRKDHETSLRRTAERQQMRLVRSTRRDPKAPEYGTYTLISRSGDGPAVLEHASMQEIEDHLSGGGSKYATVPRGERIEAVRGSIVGVQPGVIIDSFKSGKRFQVLEDGGFIELPNQGWATIPDDDR